MVNIKWYILLVQVALPSRLNHPCSRPHRHRATLSADTRGCLDTVAVLGNEAVSHSPPHQNGHYSQGSRHTSDPQTHTGHWRSDTGGSRRGSNLEWKTPVDKVVNVRLIYNNLSSPTTLLFIGAIGTVSLTIAQKGFWYTAELVITAVVAALR